MKETEFRILGSELGEEDTFIDATVDGIGDDGTVYFAEKGDNTKRTWQMEHREIKRLTNQNYMVGASKVETHPLWDRATQVGQDQAKETKTDFGKENLQEAQRSIFLAAYFETR